MATSTQVRSGSVVVPLDLSASADDFVIEGMFSTKLDLLGRLIEPRDLPIWRRRRNRAKTDASKLASQSIGSLKRMRLAGPSPMLQAMMLFFIELMIAAHRMFVEICKRIRIMRGNEVKGLGPTAGFQSPRGDSGSCVDYLAQKFALNAVSGDVTLHWIQLDFQMVLEDSHSESCGSRTVDSLPDRSCQHRKNIQIYNEVLRRLEEAGHPKALEPDFDDLLWAHFNHLPARYAIDVNAERAVDVLTHKRLLHLACDPANRPAFEVRLVQVVPALDGNSGNSVHSHFPNKGSIHPPPAFGCSPNLQALALEAINSEVQDGDSAIGADANFTRPMHEITFSTDDKTKLLSQLTSLLAEVGLNIQEAHAFSTTDGYSLDVFVVDGWQFEEVEQLRSALERELLKIEKNSWSPIEHSLPSLDENKQLVVKHESDYLPIPNDGTDAWEIDPQFLKFGSKLAAGSYGDCTYRSQEVAIKILKTECLDTELQKEFAQEVYIMRKVRHKNVVQFIGACTRPPNLCIVTEYMSGGSVYDYLHKHKGMFRLPALKVAINVSKGMDYLHQNNISHRDLKAANLLMDENDVVKVADFGVARVKSQTGVMTAETGTYRWMAPEDHKADVFSFGVVLWELLTGQIPYEYLTPLQAAVGVVQKGLRPTIPKHTHPKVAELLERCWQQDPALRPDFSEILEILKQISEEVGDDGNDKGKGFFSGLRRGLH